MKPEKTPGRRSPFRQARYASGVQGGPGVMIVQPWTYKGAFWKHPQLRNTNP